MNNKRQVKGKLGHVVQIEVCHTVSRTVDSLVKEASLRQLLRYI